MVLRHASAAWKILEEFTNQNKCGTMNGKYAVFPCFNIVNINVLLLEFLQV